MGIPKIMRKKKDYSIQISSSRTAGTEVSEFLVSSHC